MKKIFLTLLFIHSSLLIANAQWVNLNSPVHNPPEGFADNGNILYAAVAGEGVYKTTNLGNNWILTNDSISNLTINNIAVKDSFIFLVCDNGLCRSTNYGESWSNILNGSFISAIFVDSFIFVGSYNGISRTSNFGVNWELVTNGLPGNHIKATSFTFSNGRLYTCIDSLANILIYNSSNYGNNWFLVSQDISQKCNAYSLFSIGNLFFCGTSLGVYKSTNYGTNWALIPGIPGNIGLFGFASVGTKSIFISAWNKGVFISNDYGQTWIQRNEGLTTLYSTSIYKYENFLFLGTNYPGTIFRRPLNEVISVKNISSEIPDKFKLYQNYPNPFNPTTSIRYKVSRHGGSSINIKLVVYNILGEEIETLVNEKQQPGIYEVIFNGINLSSGIYFYSLIVGGKSIDTKKLILLK